MPRYVIVGNLKPQKKFNIQPADMSIYDPDLVDEWLSADVGIIGTGSQIFGADPCTTADIGEQLGLFSDDDDIFI